MRTAIRSSRRRRRIRVFVRSPRSRDAFAAVAATRERHGDRRTHAERRTARRVGASGDYFAVLGVTPALGRFFGPADDEPPGGSPVIVLGYAYWQRDVRGDRAVLGREIIVDDQPFTIIGVAPRGFNGDGLAAVDAFMPLSTSLREQRQRLGDRTGSSTSSRSSFACATTSLRSPRDRWRRRRCAKTRRPRAVRALPSSSSSRSFRASVASIAAGADRALACPRSR